VTIKFGFCVPPFAMPGPSFFRVPAWTDLEPARALDAAVEAERLGYDSVWMADHLMHGHDGAILEGWTTLSVIAGRTSKVELGTIHLAQPFRHPAILAKMAATLDALSGGRLILFYDCGWGEAEVRAYGLDWPPEQERIERMEEGLELIDALWRGDEPLSFRGRFFWTKEAICRPKPLRQPRPPVWLGEARNDRWAEATARYADGWNSVPASPTRLAEKLETIKAACRRVGRDFGELELSLETQVLIAPTDREAREVARRIAALPDPRKRSLAQPLVDALGGGDDRPLDEIVDGWLIGSAKAVARRVREYTELGVSHFMLWFLDFPSYDGVRLFAEKVAPEVRR
jgi:alkanesulfonate monooxygenase SsuD/methylene tetrahydromethanopterin reductase-like flavin-dependent oxidoreductase (luciferase family)